MDIYTQNVIQSQKESQRQLKDQNIHLKPSKSGD